MKLFQEGTALREVPAARLEFARVMHLVLRLAAADKTHSEVRGFKRPWSVRQLDFTIHLLTLPDGELASPPEGARRLGPRRAPAEGEGWAWPWRAAELQRLRRWFCPQRRARCEAALDQVVDLRQREPGGAVAG